MTRQTKTPAQRAQEAVDVLHRRLTKLRAKRQEATDQVEAYSQEIAETDGRLAYALQHPDLPTQPEQDTTTEEPA
jgi:uncharacterized protein involved in exopolysaccharide biosynthesis